MAGAWNQKSLEGLEQEEKIVVCPECESNKIEYRNGERFCKKCGLVLD